MLAFLISSKGDWLLDFKGADNWSYLKYFHSYGAPEIEAALANDYKASRLPWVLPGYIIFKIFGDIYAPYVLHSTVLCFTAAAMIYGISLMFGRFIATISTSLLLINPGFHSSNISGFWFYHGQICAMYYAVACMGVVRAQTSSRPVLWYLIAGAALASTIITSFTYLFFLPAFGALVLLHVPSFRWAMVALGSMILGGLVTILALGGVSLLGGGPFLFFGSQIAHTLKASASGGSPWEPVDRWFPLARWLAVPLAVVAATPLALVVHPLGPRAAPGRHVAACAVHLALAVSVFLAAELAHQPVLQTPFISHQLYVPCAFALAMILAVVRVRVGREAEPVFVGTVVLGTLGSLLVLPNEYRELLRIQLGSALSLGNVPGLPPSPLWSLAATTLFAIVLLMIALQLGRLMSVLVASVVLGAALSLTAPAEAAYLPPGVCESRRAISRVIHQAAQWGSDDPRSFGAGFVYLSSEHADRGPGCEPLPLRTLYIGIEQVAQLRSVAVDSPRFPSITALEPSRRDWTWLILASAAEHTIGMRTQFEEFLDSSPTPIPWRYVESVELQYEHLTIVLSVYEMPKPLSGLSAPERRVIDLAG